MKRKIAVIGVGTWAIATSILLSNNDHDVSIWSYSEAVANEINQNKKRKRLPGVTLPDLLTASSDMATTIAAVDLIVICMPSQYLQDTVQELSRHIKNQPILCLSKGLLAEKSPFISDYIQQFCPASAYALLSGPNLAEEILNKQPAAAVVASKSIELATIVQQVLSQDIFRVYTSQDVKGVEIAGVLKNIIAIASGCSDAMNCGENAKAALITRGLNEIMHFGLHFNALENTFYGLAGLGDLIATCASSKSRNYKLGYQLGSGVDFNEIEPDLKQTAEGISTISKVKVIIDQEGLSMPIAEKMYELIFESKKPHLILSELMNRKLKQE